VAVQPKECQHVAGNVVRGARMEVVCHGFLSLRHISGGAEFGVVFCVQDRGWDGWSHLGYSGWLLE
jgi:hypothetical protein